MQFKMIEVSARAYRKLTGVPGFPNLPGLLALVKILSPRLTLKLDPEMPFGVAYLAPDGYCDILAPPDPEIIAHEIGQWVISPRGPEGADGPLAISLGWAALPGAAHRRPRSVEGRTPTVGRHPASPEESGAWYWARAHLLPPEHMDRPDDEIVTASGCSIRSLRLRRLDLKHYEVPADDDPWEEALQDLAVRIGGPLHVTGGPGPWGAPEEEIEAAVEAIEAYVTARRQQEARKQRP